MDILIIKVSNGKLLSLFKVKQDYSEIAKLVKGQMLRHHPGETASAYAICDADVLYDLFRQGKSFHGDESGGGDFDVRPKGQLGSATIIPPQGFQVSALADTDDVVCYV